LAAVDSYCDNGYSTMAETKVVERAIAVVLQLLGLWDNKDQALEAFFQSSEAFVYYLAHAVSTSVATVKKLNGGEMRNKIQALCGNTPSNQRRAQQPLSQSGGTGGGGGGRDGLRDKVLAFIQAHENANDDGASVPECVQSLQFTSGYSEAAVRKMVDDLESEGHIYSTVDKDHFMLACGDEGGLRNKVLAFIRANDNGNDWGTSVPECVQNLQLASGYSEAAVRKMVDELAHEGLIYSTIDEDHFLFAS
jgi:Replication protein A C terminal